jgi:hypothetical protein
LLAKRVCSVSNSNIRINVGLIIGTPQPSPPCCRPVNELTMETKNATATQVVKAVRMEEDHGLRWRDCRARRPSGAGASIGSRGEPNGIGLVSLEGWEHGVRHMLEFRERGVALPSRRRSKLVPRLAIWDRDFSSMAVPSSVRETEESSSSTGEPDERLCIGEGGAGASSSTRQVLGAGG